MKNFTINFFLLVLTLVFVVTVINITFTKMFKSTKMNNCIESDAGEMPTILVWNELEAGSLEGLPKCEKIQHKWFDYWEYERKLKCGTFQCMLTNNRVYLPALSMYDAVLFNIAHEVDKEKQLNSSRQPQQLYILTTWTHAPVQTTVQALDAKGEFYNLTMSYRLDSDLVWAPRKFVEIETGLVVAPLLRTHWKQPPLKWNDSSIEELFVQKKRTIAWHADSCRSLSKREKLVDALMQQLDVFVYGKCGNERLFANRTFGETLASQYKFLLAFEHCFCDDYVTAHVYLALENNVVPVVFGGADYARFLPPLSFINAEDFKNVDALAEHLQDVASDMARYLRFFWWRHYYEIVTVSPFCDLCEKLHLGNALGKTQTYTNIQKWWLTGCRNESKINFTD